MKTTVSFLWISIFFLLLNPGSVTANDKMKWGGYIGVNYWYPDWSNEQDDFDSETSGLYGPTAFLHWGRLGVGLQYYSGDFDLGFPESTSKINADRTDLDLMLSYRLTEVFQVSVLYKQIDFEWDQTFSVDSEITGFGFGGGINKVFPNRFMLYGYGFYMPDLEFEQNISGFSSYTGDADGYWLEGGLGYIIPQLHILTKAGYRYQTIDIDADSNSWSEETDGFRVDIYYYF